MIPSRRIRGCYFKIHEKLSFDAMRYNEIIMEGADAPLYHGAPLPHLLRILQTDMLGKNYHRTVSLSRAYHVSNYFSASGERDVWEDYGGILVLDQRLLAQTYKIRPHNDEWAYANPDHSGFRDEQEEVVTGVIVPLSRYLISINVDPMMSKQASRDTDYMANSEDFETFFKNKRKEFKRLIGELLRHPLLNKWRPRVPMPNISTLLHYDDERKADIRDASREHVSYDDEY